MSDDIARPAATVVLLRDSSAGPEIFMVRRQAGTAFRGAHVFPGGRVDEADRHAASASWCDGIEAAHRQLHDLAALDAEAFHLAAARELFEEAGVLLARNGDGHFVSLAAPPEQERFSGYRAGVHAGGLSLRDVVQRESLRLALDALVAFAHWVTPESPIEGRRFDTRFFLTRVPEGQVPVHDDRETTHGVWVTAADAIAMAQRRQIVLPPPTWVTLRELEPHGSVDAALTWAAHRRVVRRQPSIVNHRDGRVLVMPDDTGGVAYEKYFALRDGAWGPHEGIEK